MAIELLAPKMSRVVNETLKHDALFTPDTLRAGEKEIFHIICEQGLSAPDNVVQLTRKVQPEGERGRPLIITGICEIGDKQTVVFEQADTAGVKTVAEKTLQTHCSRADCTKNGCRLLRDKEIAFHARKKS